MLWDTSSASGLTVTTMTVSPTKREPPFGAGTPGGGFLFLGMVNLTFGIPDLSIPDSPQKSSAVQKVYRRPLRLLRRHLSQRERPWQAGPLPTGRLRPDMAQKGGPCYRGQALLDKRSLSSCRWPRQRSTTVSGTSCFARPVEA